MILLNVEIVLKIILKIKTDVIRADLETLFMKGKDKGRGTGSREISAMIQVNSLQLRYWK